MATKNFRVAKNVYGALACVYPVYDSIKHGFREPNFFTKHYIKRGDYKLSEEFIDLFDSELIKQIPSKKVIDIPVRFSSSEEIEPKVYGMFYIRQGADFEFPSRILITGPKEFRERFPLIRKGAGAPDAADEFLAKIPDDEIRGVLFTDAAKRFIDRRLIVSADTYEDMLAPYFLTFPLFLLFYPLVHFGCAVLGSTFAVCIASGLAAGCFFPVRKFYNASRAYALDKKVYSLGEEYATGCREYLKACLNFGKLINKLTNFDRAGVFTAEGNVNSSSVAPYSARLEKLNGYVEEKRGREIRKSYLSKK